MRHIVRSPVLVLLSLLPVVVTAALYWLVFQQARAWITARALELLVGMGLDPTGWLAWSALLFAQLALLVVAGLSFSVVATLVASPFNDFLAEAAESRVSPPLPAAAPTSLMQKVRLLGIDLMKSLLAGTAAVLTLILSWIPVVNILALALAVLMMTFQYISYPQTRRGQGLRYGLGFLRRYFYSCAGFGLALTLLFALPFLSIFVLPLAVVGGTMLVAQVEAHGLR